MISLIFSILLVQPIFAQAKDSSTINFQIDNEKFSSALYRLGNEAHLNFTYDANDSLFSTVVSYNAVDKLPLLILDDLLSNSNHNYKQIGNQIVIFKDKDKIQESYMVKVDLDHIETSDDKTTIDKTIGINTFSSDNFHEPIIDTIFVLDTIFEIHTDTLHIIDTIYIDKEKQKRTTKSKYKNSDIDFFNPQIARDYGWSGGVFLAPILSNFSLASQNNTLSIRNFSFGIEASKSFNKWNVSAGLKLTHFSENFNHTYYVTEGGFFVTDTIDEYYTVTETDTSWYYVTDSTWKPIDNEEYSYNIKNRIGYLEFSTAVSFDYITTRKFRLYAKVGVQLGVMIYSSGLAIPDADDPVGVDFADLDFNNTSYSLLLGTGIKYRIDDHFDFNSELYYFNNFNEIVNDYPINKKLRGLGLKFGVIYYF